MKKVDNSPDGTPDETATQIAELTRQLADSQLALQNLQNQWNAAFPLQEPDIRRGPSTFITPDGTSHESIDSARLHLIMKTLGISMQGAQALIDNASTVIPIVNRAADKTSS